MESASIFGILIGLVVAFGSYPTNADPRSRAGGELSRPPTTEQTVKSDSGSKVSNSLNPSSTSSGSGSGAGSSPDLNSAARSLDAIGYTTSDKARRDYENSIRNAAMKKAAFDAAAKASGASPAVIQQSHQIFARQVNQKVGTSNPANAPAQPNLVSPDNSAGPPRAAGANASPNQNPKSLDPLRAGPPFHSYRNDFVEGKPSAVESTNTSRSDSAPSNAEANSSVQAEMLGQQQPARTPTSFTDPESSAAAEEESISEEQMALLLKLAVDGLFEPKNPEGAEKIIEQTAEESNGDPHLFLKRIGALEGFENPEHFEVFAGHLKTLTTYRSHSEVLQFLKNRAVKLSRERVNRFYAEHGRGDRFASIGVPYVAYPVTLILLLLLLARYLPKPSKAKLR